MQLCNNYNLTSRNCNVHVIQYVSVFTWIYANFDATFVQVRTAFWCLLCLLWVVVSTAAFHARVRGSVPGLGGLKETKMFLPHPRVKLSIVGSLRDREVACSASDRQESNFESCVWRTVSSHSSHYPQYVLLAQFSLYVHRWPKAWFVSFHLLCLWHKWCICNIRNGC